MVLWNVFKPSFHTPPNFLNELWGKKPSSIKTTHDLVWNLFVTTDTNASRYSLFLSQPPCCSRMIRRRVLYCAQFWLILALASSQLTNDQKAQIVDLHNSYRSTVQPQAANMQRMVSTECSYTNMSAAGTLAVWCGGDFWVKRNYYDILKCFLLKFKELHVLSDMVNILCLTFYSTSCWSSTNQSI